MVASTSFNKNNYYFIMNCYYNKGTILVSDTKSDDKESKVVSVSGKEFSVPSHILKELTWLVKKVDGGERLVIMNKIPYQVAKWISPLNPTLPEEILSAASKVKGRPEVYAQTSVFAISFDVKQASPDKVTVSYYDVVKDEYDVAQQPKVSFSCSYVTPYSNDLVAASLKQILILKK